VRPYDLAKLVGLAVVWSMQFIFLRVSVPALGPPMVAEIRAIFGALFLVPAALFLGQSLGLKHWRDYLSLGIVNIVVPFAGWSYAATALPASYLALLNGLVPLWTALLATWLLKEPLKPHRFAGCAIGISGIALIVNLGPVALTLHTVIAILAGIVGTIGWAWAPVMIKQQAGRQGSIALAGGSIAAAAILMTPAWLTAPQATWTFEATTSVMALGLVCTGAAHLALFTLVRDIGPSRAMAVGYLIPFFGVLWGWLLLSEAITLPMVFGGAMVLIAMALVLRR
jgi:drug/metabolite transporter (DMT)-like permease